MPNELLNKFICLLQFVGLSCSQNVWTAIIMLTIIMLTAGAKVIMGIIIFCYNITLSVKSRGSAFLAAICLVYTSFIAGPDVARICVDTIIAGFYFPICKYCSGNLDVLCI